MKASKHTIQIEVSRQQLILLREGKPVQTYQVSTSAKGCGEKMNSNQTPRGKHVIRAKIGKGAPLNSVYVGRRPTGEIYTRQLAAQHPNRDWILTRILWLSGLERGFNRLKDVDSMRRFIYIHGTAEEDKVGQPYSHGCIRMCNQDVIHLFNEVEVGTLVIINE